MTTTRISDEQFQAIGRALADPRRFAIMQQVAATDACLSCSALQQHEVISAATISHHLKELSEAGLIRMERDGRTAKLFFCRPTWDAYRARLAQI